MQLGIDSHIPDGLLAANVLLREKPHQGVPSWNLALHQGIDERNSTAAIGLRVGQHLGGVWSRYTGKERDTESGNDYFGARYYASSMGRWISPDWSAGAEAVPYASLDNPQSLNLYGYAGNNPLRNIDLDGHIYNGQCDSGESTGCLGNGRGATEVGTPSAVQDGWQSIQEAHNDDVAKAQQQSGNKSGQTLTAKPVKGAPKGTTEIQWQLSKKSKSGGFVVQEITTADASGNQTYHYWEAWQVSKGSKGTIYQDQGYNYDDMFRDPSGTTVTGNARFYEGLQLPSSFAPHSPGTIAGDLPATSVNPNLPTTNATAPVVRVWTAP